MSDFKDTRPANLVEHWRRLAPKLEAVRRAELRALKVEDHVQAIDALLQLGYEHGTPRTTSGLVILQRLLAKGHKIAQERLEDYADKPMLIPIPDDSV